MNNYGFSSKIPSTDKRQKVWEKQRKDKGFDDTETWALDSAFAKFVLPRLERFKEISAGNPAGISQSKWNNILQKMIDGFKEYVNRDSNDFDYEKFKKGLDLFAEHYMDLWW